MRPRQTPAILLLVLSLIALGSGSALALQNSEVPAGTRFMVELRDKLEARKIKKGKKFEVRTLEALTANDGSQIPAGAKIKGRVTSVEQQRNGSSIRRNRYQEWQESNRRLSCRCCRRERREGKGWQRG